MNRLCVILSLTFNLAFGQIQPLTGKFVSRDSYVVITDSSLEFKIANDGGLITYMYGYGAYNIQNDTVYVTTSTPPQGHNSYFQITADLPSADKITVRVYDKSDVMPFYNFVLVDKKSNEIIQGATADKTGRASLDTLPTTNTQDFIIHITSLGYDDFDIPLNEIIGKSVSVYLQPYKIIENKTAKFKWVSDNNSVKLTGPFFTPTKKPKQKRRDKQKTWVTHEAYVVASKEFVRQ